jgi:hypothetical protein
MIPLTTMYNTTETIEHIVCKTDNPDIDLLFPAVLNTEITRQLWVTRSCVNRPPKNRYFRSPKEYATWAWPSDQDEVSAFMKRPDVQAWERQHMRFKDNPVEFMRNTNTTNRTYTVRNSHTNTEIVHTLDDKDSI